MRDEGGTSGETAFKRAVAHAASGPKARERPCEGVGAALISAAPTRLGRREAAVAVGVGLKGAAGETGAGDTSTAAKERWRLSEERSERAPVSPAGALEVVTDKSRL